MNKKKVYLFELDSVRKTDDEIMYGQQCLYNEIAVNGNVVIMTFNQFVDSRAFFSLLDDDKYRNNIISLFEKGVLRISQYKDTRTLVQYLLDSIDSDKEFIYSALPIKYTQKHLVGLMKRSLIYSDLSELYEYFDVYDKKGNLIHSGKLKKDINELFKEYNKKGKEINKFISKNEEEIKKRQDEQEVVCAKLYHLLETVLSISSNHSIYTYSKRVEEYREYDLCFYINKVINDEYNIKLDTKKHKDKDIKEAREILKNIKKNSSNSNDRSVYLRKIKNKFEKEKRKNNKDRKKINKRPYQYAEIFVNLCQNYACEASIRNVSKKYNIDEEDYSSFYADFWERFNIAWDIGEKETNSKYLTDETNIFEEFKQFDKNKKIKNNIPDFSKAVRYIDYEEYKYDEILDETVSDINRYEYNLNEQKIENKKRILNGIRKQTINALMWLAVAYFINNFALPFIKEQIFKFIPGLNQWEKSLETSILALNIFIQFIKSIISTLLTEAISKKFAEKFSWVQSFSDALSKLIRLLTDLYTITTESNKSIEKLDNNKYLSTEEFNSVAEIMPIYSVEMKRYINLKKALTTGDRKYKYFSNELFCDKNNVYKFVDYTNSEIRKKINNQEEENNKKFGFIYSDKYNTLLVDPVEYNGELIAYDRVVSTTGKDGVVIVAKYNGKFIMLKQFRHAFRKEMFNFPRGFAELSSKSPDDDALRELEEEIGVNRKACSKPIFLGKIAPDSGLTDRFAYAYYIEIKSYDQKDRNHEGIKEIKLFSKKELEDLICNNSYSADMNNCLVDGFSLAAYMLYEIKIENKKERVNAK